MEANYRNSNQNLFDKFRKDNLNKDEIIKLLSIINDKENVAILEQYYTEIWDSSSKRHSEVDSKRLLVKIKSFIPEQEINEPKIHILKSPRKRAALIFLKYAAMFILAFSLAWAAQNLGVVNGPNNRATKENIVEVSYGSKSKIQLPDGTIVNLNSGSQLTYPSTFVNGKRDVYLAGEAFFNVKASEDFPFYVHTSDLTIKVTGTKFNVKSYPGAKSIETTLVTGKLEIIDNKKKDEIWAVLSPNETAIFNKSISEKNKDIRETKKELEAKEGIKIQIKKEVNTSEACAWKDNQLVFNNEKFQGLAIRLERWYNVKIDIQNEKLINERFTGKFDMETIEQALNALQLIVPFEYKMEKNNIIINNTTN